jgi:cyclopropane-fatty-acyl-phospholipid synthase
MEKLFRNLLDQAQIQLNGSNPWDIQIDDPKVIEHIFSHGSLGLGETYMQRKWHVDHLDEFFSRILRAQLDQKVKPSKLIVHAINISYSINSQSGARFKLENIITT